MKQWISVWAVSAAVTAAAQDWDVSKYSPNARMLMEKLHQQYRGEIVPRFAQNGGRLIVISYRSDPSEARRAVYDQTSRVIRIREAQEGKLDWRAMDDIAHEFWHAYWHQIGSKGDNGPDPATYRVFRAALEWVRKQELRPTGEETRSPPARWRDSAWEEFADELVGNTLNTLLAVHRALQADSDSGRISRQQAALEWESVLAGKGKRADVFGSVFAYRNTSPDDTIYYVRANIAEALPQLLRRLAELYGLKF